MKLVTCKTLFVIQPQSMVDVITNSSSELFVFEGKEKEVIESMIRDIYPGYLEEYENLKCLNELDDEDFETYLGWVYPSWRNDIALSEHFNIPPEILYRNWDARHDLNPYWYGYMSEEGRKLIKSVLPMDSTFVLYSLEENPDWDMQEKLEMLGYRYHLG